MRLDTWIKKVGILKRRTLAARLLRNGRILVDDQPAKPATTVRVGQTLRIEGARFVRTWEVLAIPLGNVAKADRESHARLIEETRREEPWETG
jgi:ribosomal 50S subunit-recycling heat shock protein